MSSINWITWFWSSYGLPPCCKPTLLSHIVCVYLSFTQQKKPWTSMHPNVTPFYSFLVDSTPNLYSKFHMMCTPNHSRWINPKPIEGQVIMLNGWEVLYLCGSKMTLNYGVIVERVSFPNGVVGGSIPTMKFSLYLTIKLDKYEGH
jgi:hypothetical protein